LQQGGVGLLLSTLIVMAPPMAAAFFQGTLGQFASYSSFGNVGSQLGGQDQQAIAQGRQAAASSGSYNPPPQQDAQRQFQTQSQGSRQASLMAYGSSPAPTNGDDIKPGEFKH
jgi:type IV secretion system protein VirB6